MYDNISLKEIVKQRDRLRPNSKLWNILDFAKTKYLEHFYGSKMDEELKSMKQDDLYWLKDGFSTFSQSFSDRLERESVIVTRAEAEFNTDYRQLVAQSILEYNDKTTNKRLLGLTERTKHMKDTAVLENTLGFLGGHVNKQDKFIYNALIREITEETNIVPSLSKINPIGFIKTKSFISDCHLCCLYKITVKTLKIRSHEREKIKWFHEKDLIEKLTKSQQEFDSWTYVALTNLLKIQTQDQ